MSENQTTNGALVRVERVEKVFHRGSEDIHVLADLSLDVPAREFLALMGPSGSGKTHAAQFDRRLGPSDQRHSHRGR